MRTVGRKFTGVRTWGWKISLPLGYLNICVSCTPETKLDFMLIPRDSWIVLYSVFAWKLRRRKGDVTLKVLCRFKEDSANTLPAFLCPCIPPTPSIIVPSGSGKSRLGLLTGTACDEQRQSSPCLLRHSHTLLWGPCLADNTAEGNVTVGRCYWQFPPDSRPSVSRCPGQSADRVRCVQNPLHLHSSGCTQAMGDEDCEYWNWNCFDPIYSAL